MEDLFLQHKNPTRCGFMSTSIFTESMSWLSPSWKLNKQRVPFCLVELNNNCHQSSNSSTWSNSERDPLVQLPSGSHLGRNIENKFPNLLFGLTSNHQFVCSKDEHYSPPKESKSSKKKNGTLKHLKTPGAGNPTSNISRWAKINLGPNILIHTQSHISFFGQSFRRYPCLPCENYLQGLCGR